MMAKPTPESDKQDKWIRQIGPRRPVPAVDIPEHAAHRGRARFLLVFFGSLLRDNVPIFSSPRRRMSQGPNTIARNHLPKSLRTPVGRV